jgi:hypothetical protein
LYFCICKASKLSSKLSSKNLHLACSASGGGNERGPPSLVLSGIFYFFTGIFSFFNLHLACSASGGGNERG